MIAVIDIVALLQNNQLVRRKYYKMKWKKLLDMLLKDKTIKSFHIKETKNGKTIRELKTEF